MLSNNPRVFHSAQRTLKWKGESGVSTDTECKLHLRLIRFVLASLGADTSSWETLDWAVPDFTPVQFSAKERSDAVARLVDIVAAFSK